MVQQQAALLSFVEAFWIMGVIFLCMLPLVLLLRNARDLHPHDQAPRLAKQNGRKSGSHSNPHRSRNPSVPSTDPPRALQSVRRENPRMAPTRRPLRPPLRPDEGTKDSPSQPWLL